MKEFNLTEKIVIDLTKTWLHKSDVKEFIKRLKAGHCNNPKCKCCFMKNREIERLAGDKLI